MTAPAARIVTAVAAGAFTLTAALPAQAGFSCSGTEPFWDLTVNRGIVLQHAGIDTTRYPKASMKQVGTTKVYRARRAGQSPISVAVRVNGSCSDGMSDQTYPYEATVSVEGQPTLHGCCRKW